jgi:FtsZ-binding cell division protein ZapB
MGDTRALILTTIGTGVAVVTVLSMQIAAVNTRIDDMNLRIDDINRRIDDLRTEVRDLRADHVRFDERLDAVEVAVGRVEQRLDTQERVLLPPREPDGD